jgi:hypothetical protein
MFRKREVIGFVAAPLPFLAPFLVMFGAILYSDPQEGPAIAEMAGTLLVSSYAATLLVGLPVHLTLRALEKRQLFAYLTLTFAGAVLAGALAAIGQKLFLPPQEDNPFQFNMWSRVGPKVTLAFAVVACISACIFWMIAVRPRPERRQ